MLLPFDFHSHTTYQDGNNSAQEMVDAAIDKGLTTYGISEHHPRHPDFRYSDDPPGEIRGLKEWPNYLAEMDELKEKYAGKIELLKASEFDWLHKDHLDEWEKWRAESDYDYIIGSVHYLGHWGFDYFEDWEKCYKGYDSIEQIYETYYQEVVSMVESASHLFEIVGHVDLIKKFVVDKPQNSVEMSFPALDAIAKTDLVMELSSAGLVSNAKDWYPNQDILRAARERDIPITINSDAHQVERIAENFEKAVELARSVGYDSVVCFHRGGEREIVRI